MASTVCGTFVSHKVNKVRWKPDSNNTSIVTGSSDDEENRLTVWKYYKTENEDSFAKWKSLCSIIHYGDVTEIKFIEDDVFCASSSFGGVGLFRISEHSGKAVITRLTYWDSVHFHGCREPASGNDIACFDNDIISVGDDGRIVQISIKEETPVRVIDNADSCVIRCVSVNKLNEVLTGNSRGQMKLWDLRSYSNFPQTNFTLSGSGQVGFTRVICHPTQTHIKLAGGEDGALTIWDLRNNELAVNSISAHAQSVNELMFHPDRPEHLYSCSSNGQLWHWDSSQMTRSYPSQFPLSESNNVSYEFEETSCPWISKNLKNRITVYSIIQNLHLPINSLDVCSNYVVCGCDNEAVYLITNFCN